MTLTCFSVPLQTTSPHPKGPQDQLLKIDAEGGQPACNKQPTRKCAVCTVCGQQRSHGVFRLEQWSNLDWQHAYVDARCIHVMKCTKHVQQTKELSDIKAASGAETILTLDATATADQSTSCTTRRRPTHVRS